MAINFINESAALAIATIYKQPSIDIESASIWEESRQRLSAKKPRKYSNNLITSASTITQVTCNSNSEDAYITYTETIVAKSNETNRLITKFPELNPATDRLAKLNDQIAPNTRTRTLHTTFKLLARLFEIAQKNDLWWGLPLINVGFDSEVILEWWHKDRKLDFDILSSNIDYMKVWGADIDSEMEDGSITINESVLTSLWKWIAN
jgi:hypothetical protein